MPEVDGRRRLTDAALLASVVVAVASTRRSCDGWIRGGDGESSSAPLTVDDKGQVTTDGGKASPNPLLPVIDRAYRSLQVALEELLRPAPWALATVPKRTPTGPEHPWLRHHDETAKAYAAFRFYRDLGEQRSAVKVREQFGLVLRLVERWSSVHAWVLRTRLWDEHQDRISVAVSTDTIQAMRLEHAEWAALGDDREPTAVAALVVEPERRP